MAKFEYVDRPYTTVEFILAQRIADKARPMHERTLDCVSLLHHRTDKQVSMDEFLSLELPHLWEEMNACIEKVKVGNQLAEWLVKCKENGFDGR